MGKTAISPPRNPAAVAPPPAVHTARPASLLQRIVKVLSVVASLRLTVVLFCFALVLVFCGTLAQKDAGIWTVVNTYFRSAYVWVPFQIFFAQPTHVSGGFPFPGGWLIGGLLLANLLAAHAVRFKISWKRSGILFIHAGLVVMMLSELITGLYAVEGRMTIVENLNSSFIEQHNYTELAIIDPSDAQTNQVAVIPDGMLRKGGVIQHELLPFDVEVVRYMSNSDIREPAPGIENPATAGDGLTSVAVERKEVAGAALEQMIDMPSAYLTLKDKKTGESLGTYLVSTWWSDWLNLADLKAGGIYKPQQVKVNHQTYDLFLRSKRTYKPYTVHLQEFHHDVYVGTDTPRNYASLVRVVDPVRNEDREVLIYMNQPLRYAGETFYQSGFLPGDRGTILQVVKNPGWLLPYISCIMVAAGMLFHFGLHLTGFLRRRAAS